MSQKKEKTIRNLILFSLIVIGLPWLGVFLDQGAGNPASEGLGILLWMAAPMLATLILRAFFGGGWKDFYLKPNFKGNGLWYLVSLLFYPVCLILIILIGRILGVSAISGFTWADYGKAILASIPFALFKNLLVEEGAWYGFLGPKTYKLKKNRLLSHLFIGLIQGLWHAPYYFIFTEQSNLSAYTTQSPMMVFILTVIGAMTVAIVYGEIYLRVKSIWPLVLLHAVGSAVLVPLVMEGWLALVPGKEWIGTPGADGLFSILLSLGFGLILMLKVPRETE